MNVWIKIQNFLSISLGPAINQLNQRLYAFQGNGENAGKTWNQEQITLENSNNLDHLKT